MKFKIKGEIKDGILYGIAFWLVLIFCGSILLDKVIMPYVSGHFNKSILVPNVTGKTVKEATDLMKASGLQVTIAPEKRASGLPEGMVMQQIPNSGRSVKEGRMVQLVLSAGAKELIMQNFRGTSLANAQIQLNQLGLKYSIQYTEDESVPPGNIVRTQPEANSIIPAETNVLLIVAEGTVMPNLIGKSIEDARLITDSLKLNLQEEVADSGAHISGQILAQKPKPGSVIRLNDPIVLRVAP